jgi:transcriptional regulator with XRE-family HTH domain
MIAKALDTMTPTLRDVAGRIGATYGAVRSYRLGSRTPPPATVRKLAAALRAQGVELLRIAKQLDETTGVDG